MSNTNSHTTYSGLSEVVGEGLGRKSDARRSTRPAKALRQACARTQKLLVEGVSTGSRWCAAHPGLAQVQPQGFFTPRRDGGAHGDGGLMAEPSFVEQVTTLNATLSSIEERLARGQAPVEGLEDFKSALDDVRLRLWGLLSAAGGDDYKGFQERFRIRRATEMSRGLGGDLRTGAISGRHRELAGLREAANELAQSIEQAHGPAF